MEENLDKTKILFDSNVYDVIVEQEISNSFFYENNLEVISTKINEVEHSDMPNKKNIKKNNIQEKLQEITKKENREVGYFGFDEDPDAVGFATLSDSRIGGYLISNEDKDFIEKDGKKQERDRSLIKLARIENALFITYDVGAYKHAIKANIQAVLLNHKNDSEIALDLKAQINKLTLINDNTAIFKGNKL